MYEHAYGYTDKYMHARISEKLGVKVKYAGGKTYFLV